MLFFRNGCRGTSIKTRIETKYLCYVLKLTECCRGTSIKTRIETIFYQLCILLRYVAEELPLKQGLKPELPDEYEESKDKLQRNFH